MFVFWKKIEFYKGQSDCEAIVIVAWDLGQSLDEPFLEEKPYKLLVFNIFKAITWLTMALEILYSKLVYKQPVFPDLYTKIKQQDLII